MQSFIRPIFLLMLIMFISACSSDARSATTISTVTIDGVEKQVIKLAAINRHNDWLFGVIKGFNNSSETYHVEASYYMNTYVSPFAFVEMVNPGRIGEFVEAVAEAELQFNIDLANGNIPDIVLFPSQMQSNTYITKGLFTDLNEFMDNDPDFDRADYLPSLFEVFDRKGGIYEIPPMFLMYGIYAKTTDVGTDVSWTLDEFSAYIETKPDAEYILASMTKREFIIKTTQYLFVNPVAGEVKFDREEFKKILAIAERFPIVPYDYSDERGNWEDYFWTDARNGDPIMLPLDIYNFHMPMLWGNSFFGEEVTWKGWPSSADSGPLFSAADYFSIMKAAENLDGGWEFLKYALNHVRVSPEMQVQLPVNLSLLEGIKNEQVKFINNSPFYNSEHDKLKSLAGLDRLMTLFKSANALKREEFTINKIIDEELGIYLSGQKSADEIIDIIENRIALYLAEQH